MAAYSMGNLAEYETCRAFVAFHRPHYSHVAVAVAVAQHAAEILSFYSDLIRVVVESLAERAIAVQFVADAAGALSAVAVVAAAASIAPTFEFVDF